MLAHALPVASRSRLAIYTTFGQLATILVEANEPAGEREVTWRAADLASGVYAYRLEAFGISDPRKSFAQTGKTLFLK